jgi:molecular chaperone IbpA
VATVIALGQLDAEIKNPFTEGFSLYQRLAVGGSASKTFLLPKSCLKFKGIIMTQLDLVNHALIGFDRIFNQLDNVRVQNKTYPPHNVIKIDDDNWLVELAAAGFSRDELTVELHENTLTIRGQKAEQEDRHYLYRGLAMRNFEKSLYLQDHIKIKRAEYKEGLLFIYLESKLPETKKPKQITIN